MLNFYVFAKKSQMLSSVSAAVIVAGMAGSTVFMASAAMAAEVSVDVILPSSGLIDAQVTGSTILSSIERNENLVEAFITLSGNTVTSTGDSTVTTDIEVSSLEVDGNSASATAIGNTVDSEVDITAISNSGGSGIGLVNAMANSATAEVRSEILGLNVGYGLDGTPTGDVTGSSVSVSTNNLNATTQLNVARSVVDETTLANQTFSSTTPGSVTAFSGSTVPEVLGAAGEIVVATSQLNASIDDTGAVIASGFTDGSANDTNNNLGGSSAIIALNDIGFAIDGTVANGSFEVDANELLAQFQGNNSTTGVDASTATSFEGSITVANQQNNNFLSSPRGVLTTLPTASAWVFGNEILADFTAGADASTLDGAVSVSTNSIGAETTGNTGSSFILFTAETDLIGADGGADSRASADFNNFAEPTSTSGDLVLVNQQANAAFATSSRSVFNQIGVIFDDIAPGVDGSGVIVDQNTIFADSTGNNATNVIAADANQINATAALSSSQTNARRGVDTTDPNDAGIAGSVDTTASVSTAIIGVTSTDFVGTTLNNSAIDVTANAVTARAEGNDINNTVSLSADTGLTAGDDFADVDGGFNLTSVPSTDTFEVDGGALLSNFQGLVNSLTSASVDSSVIGVDIEATGNVVGSSLTVAGADLNGNGIFSTEELTRITATALGQNAVNNLSLSSEAGTLSGSAALSSVQLQGGQDANDNASGTFADVQDSVIGVDLKINDGALTQSDINVTRSEVAATAQGNRVGNTVDVSAGSTLVLDADGDIEIDLVDTGDGQLKPEIDSDDNAVILANTQISNASTGANIDDIQLGTIVRGDAVSSNIGVDFNAVRAEAMGNVVASQAAGNSLTIRAGTLDASGAEDTLAGISNVQDLTGRPGTTTTVTANVDDVFFDNDLIGNATSANLSASSNLLTARAMGNVTTENFLNVIGGNISYDGGDQDSDVVLGLVDTSGAQESSPMDIELDSEAGFVVANLQRGSVDGVSATAGTGTGVGADVTITGDIASTGVDVSSNRFEALAFDNTGANTIQFGEVAGDGSIDRVTTLATTSAIVSQQISAGDIVATLGEAGSAGTPATGDNPFIATGIFSNISTALVNGTNEDDGVEVTAATVTITSANITPDQATALIATGDWESDGSGGVRTSDLNVIGDFFGNSSLVFPTVATTPALNSSFAGSGTILGTPAIDPTFAAPTIISNIGGDITGSSVDVSSNVNTAAARANSITNTVNVLATTLTGDTGGSTPGITVGDAGTNVNIDTSDDNQINSLQTRDAGAEVTATAFAGVGISTNLNEGIDSVTVLGSELNVDNNVLLATAEGNVANNLISVDATTIGIDAGSAADVSTMTNALSNFQLSLAGGSATAGSEAQTGFVADLFAPIAVENSSVSISDNTTQATTVLNTATNTVDISGVNVRSLSDSLPGQASFDLDTPEVTVDGFSFGEAVALGEGTLSNVQLSVASDIDDVATATAVMNIGNTDALVADTNGLTNSNIVVDGNRAQATVTGNTAANTLAQNGDTNLNATSVLSSIQYADIAINADSTLDARLELSSGSSIPPHSNSSVSMSENVNFASGTANVAQNRVMVSGANIEGAILPLGSGFAFIGALTDDTSVLGGLANYDSSAVGSTVANNLQFSDADVTVNALTNILHSDVATAAGILGTSMMQDDNLTIAQAVGNLSGPNARRTAEEQMSESFSDTIRIMGGNIDGASVALSSQEGNGNISATANASIVNDMFGDDLVGSMVSLSGNQTAAFATQNDATMSIMVDGTSITGAESDTFAGFGDGATPAGGQSIGLTGLASVGDNIIVGQQRSIGETVTSSVDMTVEANQSSPIGGVSVGTPIETSSLSLTNNIAEASATGNRASYTLGLNAATTLSATGAISNDQFNSAGITATATMAVEVGNGLALSEDLTGSSAAVSDNAVIAQARGNVGSTALNVAAGSGINTGTGINGVATAGTASVGNGITTPTVSLNSGTVARADYAVMSNQRNTGPVNAVINGATGQILNTGEIASSSVRVTGNRMVAEGIGNSAVNQITATSLNNGTTSYAMANTQVNSGNVTSQISSSGFGVSTGTMTGSSARVSDNSLSARSVGNSAVNRITGN